MLEFQSASWYIKGKPNPPPKIIKYRIIKLAVQDLQFRSIVETGTYLGDFIAFIQSSVDKIYSIEISKKLYYAAKQRFEGSGKIQLRCGNSAKILPSILSEIRCPSLFWLDAHFSGGITSGDEKAPVIVELENILDHSLEHSVTHIIFIDDAKDFTGANGFPTLQQIFELVSRKQPSSIVSVRDDMIRIQPPRPRYGPYVGQSIL